MHKDSKEKIIERIRSMFFLCIYCDSPNPMAASVVEFESHDTGAHATAFFICPGCQNKFMAKIQDLGKVQ